MFFDYELTKCTVFKLGMLGKLDQKILDGL
jgi:hypothetical protein